MDIRELLRLARSRWPEPEGKSHHITLNNPAHDVWRQEEDWLTFGVWVEGRTRYFHIVRENEKPQAFLDSIEFLIRRSVEAERKNMDSERGGVMDERTALYAKKMVERSKRGTGTYYIAEGWARSHIDAKKELYERVFERECEGYVPVGGVSVTTIRKQAIIGDIEVILYSQAMVRYEHE